MKNYDSWKLSNNEKPICCDKCGRETLNLAETTEKTFICPECADLTDSCARCDKIILSSHYDHSEFCDDCCDLITDRLNEKD